MKKEVLIVITLFICINGIQQSNGILDLQNLKAHQLFTKNVQFDQEFNEVPKVVVSIKQIIGEQYELYTRTSNINLIGFDLQIISSSDIENIKINYFAINDNSLNIVCENYQTKKDQIVVPFNQEHKQVATFITGLKLQKHENIYFKLSSITNSQIFYETKQQAIGLCLVIGENDKIVKNKQQITTKLKDNKLEFDVENIEDLIKLPLENQILSFDDIVNKLSVETKEEQQEQQIQTQNEEEQYFDIDSIQIETLGINIIQENIEDDIILSVDIEYLEPEKQLQSNQFLPIEEKQVEKVQEKINEIVDEQIQLEQQKEKKFLAQINQVNVESVSNIESTKQKEIALQEMYQLTPSNVDELDMDALYIEFKLNQELNEDLIAYSKNINGITDKQIYNSVTISEETEKIQKQDQISNQKIQQKYVEPQEFKQPKEKIEDVMKDLQITNDIKTTEDEKQLITQLKQKSAELNRNYNMTKKQTEVSTHSIDKQYPKIESDSKINYEVESKYMEWSMSQDQKIKKIGLDLTDDDLKNPRFSLLQMDKKSDLDIQKQIYDFLGLDEFSFVMIKQNLRAR